MESDQPVYIYELRDPDTGLVRYVGRSKNVEHRLESHLWLAKRNAHHSPRMNEWLGSLIKQGKYPTVTIAKIAAWEKREEEEMNHIHALLDQGCDLLNATTYAGYRYRHNDLIVTKQKAFYKSAGAIFYGGPNGADVLILNEAGGRALIALYNLRNDQIVCRTVKLSQLEERLESSAIDQVLQQVTETQARAREWALDFTYPIFRHRKRQSWGDVE